MLVITYLSLWYVTLQPVEEALRALVEAEVTSLFTEIFVKNLWVNLVGKCNHSDGAEDFWGRIQDTNVFADFSNPLSGWSLVLFT